jgi:CheY-like chemotaxis protein
MPVDGREHDRRPARAAASLRVLVGDADEATATLLESMLELGGCDVIVTRTGLDLIAAAINELPHLVIFEGRLPGMDGWAACDVLSHAMADTPLVFLSTQSGTADFQRAKENGASCCIRKPFALGDLLRIVEPLARDLDRVHGREALEDVDAVG